MELKKTGNTNISEKNKDTIKCQPVFNWPCVLYYSIYRMEQIDRIN